MWNTPSFRLRKIGKEHACPLTEMSEIAIGTDLGTRAGAGGAMLGSVKAFSCPLNISLGILRRQMVCVHINESDEIFQVLIMIVYVRFR